MPLNDMGPERPEAASVDSAIRAAIDCHAVVLLALPERLEEFHGHCLSLSLIGSAMPTFRLATPSDLPQGENIISTAQGRGYGRLLLDFAEQESRRQGFGAIRLYTNSLMTENLRLYPRRGYVETHRGREKGFSRVYMTKQL
jgi:GNAT superfamily N-acetyltransferase